MFATLEEKIIVGVALLAMLLGAVGTYTFHERAKGRASELADLQKSSSKLIADDNAEIDRLTKNYTAATTALTEKTDALDKANAATAASDTERLRQFNAYRNQLAKLQSAAQPAAAPAKGTGGTQQSEDFVGELGFAGIALADALRDNVTALTSCMTDRDSVTTKPKPK